MVLIIAAVFILAIIWGCIKSSSDVDDIGEQMDEYEEEVEIVKDSSVESGEVRELLFLKEYIEKLESWRRQCIITLEDYDTEMKKISKRLDTLEALHGIREENEA